MVGGREESETSMSTSDSVAGANGPRTMEEIRESLRETAALMAENAREMAELKEQGKETDRRMKETDRQMKDADRRLKKAERLRSRAGLTVYGAVAYLRCDESLVRYAERKGLFVIRATGSSASIVNLPDFEPRVLA